jgi:hypothetical protein
MTVMTGLCSCTVMGFELERGTCIMHAPGTVMHLPPISPNHLVSPAYLQAFPPSHLLVSAASLVLLSLHSIVCS